MLTNPRDTLERLVQRRDLAEAEAAALLESLTRPELAPAMAGALVVASAARTTRTRVTTTRGGEGILPTIDARAP